LVLSIFSLYIQKQLGINSYSSDQLTFDRSGNQKASQPVLTNTPVRRKHGAKSKSQMATVNL
jgi:hypothetical protein